MSRPHIEDALVLVLVLVLVRLGAHSAVRQVLLREEGLPLRLCARTGGGGARRSHLARALHPLVAPHARVDRRGAERLGPACDADRGGAARAAVHQPALHVSRPAPAEEEAGGEGVAAAGRVLDRPLLVWLEPPLLLRRGHRAVRSQRHDDEWRAARVQAPHRLRDLVPCRASAGDGDAGDGGGLALVAEQHVCVREQLEEPPLPGACRVRLRHNRDARTALRLGSRHQPRHRRLQPGAVVVSREVEVAGAWGEQSAHVQVRLAQVCDGSFEGDKGAVAASRQADADALAALAARREGHPGLAGLGGDELAVEVGPHPGVEHAAAERPRLVALPPSAAESRELHRRVECGAARNGLDRAPDRRVSVPLRELVDFGDDVEVRVADDLHGRGRAEAEQGRR
eukprot:CAMPEP_0196674708 /NCGR_PEP_ID=MMETSP1090-20130531/3646_1 /TAXON_ID=37098 /ORGANISM="Isochrysis sp, Strain CCMP1244" /LENGTH=398 /DNA_ID=CAMNT_0042012515 /DNA_START=155 /DNA_END=1351 /DNA_ORIENTATION=-